jgi:uncharacterized protein (TIGR02145 family)
MNMKKMTFIILIGASMLLFSCTKSENSEKVKIGDQWWAAKNLNTSVFRNGDVIKEAKSNDEWVKAGNDNKPAWCYYGNNQENSKENGKLYNWFAVNDQRGIAPVGWHVASDTEWALLISTLGGDKNAPTKMKSTSGWEDSSNGTNISGFSAFPSGYRNFNGAFGYFVTNAYWWSSTEADSIHAVYHNIYYFTNVLTRDIDKKQVGFSVRCIKD